MATNAFGAPTNLNQFQAILNGASKNSLVNQLYAGKTSQSTPMVASPNVVASSSQVKSPSQANIPPIVFGVPQTTAKPANTMIASNGAPMSGPAPLQNSPLLPPTNQPVTSHSVTDSQGNTTTQKYDTTANTTAETSNVPLIPPSTNFTTPSGATVDASGNLLSKAPVSALSSATSGLMNNAGASTAIGQSAADIGAKYGKQISDIGQQAAINEESVGGQGLLPVAMGRAQQIATTANSAQEALAAGESAALQGTGQQLTANSNAASALNNAGALSTPSNQFLSTSYGNQVLDSNGQPVGGGSSGTLPPTAQAFVNSLATQVQNGQMTRDEASSQLNAYGPVGLQALNTALGSGFNTNSSNASAGTTATGQQIKTAADSTNKALDTLSTSFYSLPAAQTGGIPLTNSIAQWIGSNLGDAALTQYKTNLADARSQLIGVLNSSGGTPTGNEATANEYLPDNMTPAQFQQNVGTATTPGIVRQLIDQKVTSFTGSGNQNNSNANSTNPTGWF